MSDEQAGAFIWYELLTPEPETATAFYAAVVGWTFTDSGMPDMDYRIGSASGHDVVGVMGLTQDMLDHGATPTWLGYVAVPDVDEAVQRWVADGGTLHLPATEVEGVGRFAMMGDPQGAVLYVMTPSGSEPSLSFRGDNDPRVGHCGWNELATPDPVAARAFYGRHFGWVHDGSMPMGDLGDYDLLAQEADGVRVQLGAVMPMTPEIPAPGWTYYFRVADVGHCAEEIPRAGGQITMGPHQVPGDEWIICGIDPTGAPFAVLGPNTKAGDAATTAG